MAERRKSPRYNIRLPVYFPDLDAWGQILNVSLDGCYINVAREMAVGMVTEFWVELPVVGVISLKGYVHHTRGKDPGIGLQFVGVRFAKDETEMYNIYSRFVKTLSRLEPLKEEYDELVRKGELRKIVFPYPPKGFEK